MAVIPPVELRLVLQHQSNFVLRLVLSHCFFDDILHSLGAAHSVPRLYVNIPEVVDMELDPIPTLAELLLVLLRPAQGLSNRRLKPKP